MEEAVVRIVHETISYSFWPNLSKKAKCTTTRHVPLLITIMPVSCPLVWANRDLKLDKERRLRFGWNRDELPYDVLFSRLQTFYDSCIASSATSQ